MPEQLQHLIDRIQKEGVATAQEQADALLAKAREKAAAVVKEAEAQAAARLEQAEKDAEALTERSLRTIEQASRDLLITLGKSFENLVQELVSGDLDAALDADTVKAMVVKLAEAYGREGGAEGRIEVLLSEADAQALSSYFSDRLRERFRGGVDVRSDHDVVKGFRVSFEKGSVYHDFTAEAMADALGAFLRPQLAGIVKRAAAPQTSDGES